MGRAIMFVTLALVVSICSADYSKSQIAQMLAPGKECMQINNIPFDSDVIEQCLYNRRLINDETTLKFMACICEKLGWIDSNGKLHNQVMIDYFAQQFQQDLVEKVINYCAKGYVGDNISSVGEKLYRFHQCYFANKKYE